MSIERTLQVIPRNLLLWALWVLHFLPLDILLFLLLLLLRRLLRSRYTWHDTDFFGYQECGCVTILTPHKETEYNRNIRTGYLILTRSWFALKKRLMSWAVRRRLIVSRITTSLGFSAAPVHRSDATHRHAHVRCAGRPTAVSDVLKFRLVPHCVCFVYQQRIARNCSALSNIGKQVRM